MSNFAEAILKSFYEVTSPGSNVHSSWIQPYQGTKNDPSAHHFVFFLKPEATNVKAGVKVDVCLKEAITALEKGVSGKPVIIGGIRVLGGPYLDQNSIMVQHYGVIAKISKEGESAISEDARKVLKTTYAEDIKSWSPEYYQSHVLGGHQFLQKYPEFNAFSLLALNDNLTITRLGPGTYSIKVKVRGELFIVLNSFHPYQVVPYNSAGNAIIVFECSSTASFQDLRTNLAGPTDPTSAPSGSIRRTFLEKKDACGLATVDRGSNCIHMSAGPLEGMIELQRFFSEGSNLIDFDQTTFGQQLSKGGLSKDNVLQLSKNPQTTLEGVTKSAFDLTEEKNSDEAVQIFLKAKY
eukprot:TRINITY_DN27701_c0_g1_i1.p1 TRINITY_DN27701_c0_g1~~TRINITY_DN27701_c0_g1_i1.p1  ORF type:complete len:351 (-),score=52.88 TRINITY_DN27701_c0_g1_i1:103-1155(-)